MKGIISTLVGIVIFTVVILGCTPKITHAPAEILPPDYRNQQLPVVRKYEALKQQTVFKNAFEKKGEVCPLCQF